MKKEMIAMVVDHPKRDLLLTLELAFKVLKYKICNKFCIIPGYCLDNFLLSSQIDRTKIIIYNFLRKNNADKIKYSYLKGVFNIIYDTEGAPSHDGLGLKNSLKKLKNYFKYVDHYLFWGDKQRKDIIKNLHVSFPTSVVGFLRYGEKKNNKSGYILINTNFSAVAPKYNTGIKAEYKDYIVDSSLNYEDQKKVEIEIKEIKKKKSSFIKIIKKFSKDLPNDKFVIRPHPFEDEKEYEFLEKKIKNIFLDKSLTSVDALTNAKLLIHTDCTTAVEAFFMGIPILNLDWIKNKKRHVYELTDQIGYISKNYNDALNFIKKRKKIIVTNKKQIINFFGKKKINKFENFLNVLKKYQVKKKVIKLNNPKYPTKQIIKVYLQKFMPVFLYNLIFIFLRGKKIFLARKNKDLSYEIFKRKNKDIKVEKDDNCFFLSL